MHSRASVFFFTMLSEQQRFIDVLYTDDDKMEVFDVSEN